MPEVRMKKMARRRMEERKETRILRRRKGRM